MNNLQEKFVRWLIRFIMGAAVLFGVMLVMVMAFVLFWDRPNVITTLSVVLVAYLIGYAIDKFYIKPEEHEKK